MIILSILGFVCLFLLALWFLVAGLTIIVGGAFYGAGREGVIPLVLSGLVFWLAFYLLPLHVTFN